MHGVLTGLHRSLACPLPHLCLPSSLSGLLVPPAPSSLLAQSFAQRRHFPTPPRNVLGPHYVTLQQASSLSSTYPRGQHITARLSGPPPLAFSTWCMLYVLLLQSEGGVYKQERHTHKPTQKESSESVDFQLASSQVEPTCLGSSTDAQGRAGLGKPTGCQLILFSGLSTPCSPEQGRG